MVDNYFNDICKQINKLQDAFNNININIKEKEEEKNDFIKNETYNNMINELKESFNINLTEKISNLKLDFEKHLTDIKETNTYFQQIKNINNLLNNTQKNIITNTKKELNNANKLKKIENQLLNVNDLKNYFNTKFDAFTKFMSKELRIVIPDLKELRIDRFMLKKKNFNSIIFDPMDYIPNYNNNNNNNNNNQNYLTMEQQIQQINKKNNNK